MPDFPFEVVDVFTDRPFAGNQLAVITDARGMDTDTMQAVAREFNFAESTFVLPPNDPAHTARVRIFTPGIEMPFAGHPNVGTAHVIARMGSLFGKPVGGTMVFEELAGLVHVAVTAEQATVRAPRSLELGPEVNGLAVAELANIPAESILIHPHLPRFASVGAEFLFAEVTPEALDAASHDMAAFRKWQSSFGRAGLLGLHIFARRADDIEARMFAPLDGVPEDAATGSAAAALGALLAHRTGAPQRFTVLQGRHIGRPSRIDVMADSSGVSIGGPCAAIMRGTLSL